MTARVNRLWRVLRNTNGDYNQLACTPAPVWWPTMACHCTPWLLRRSCLFGWCLHIEGGNQQAPLSPQLLLFATGGDEGSKALSRLPPCSLHAGPIMA